MLSGADNEHELFVPWPHQCSGIKLDDICAEETQGSIHIHRVGFDLSCGLIRRIPFIGHRLQASEFVKRSESKSVDIIHGHNPLACAMACIDYKRLHGIPLVYEAHGIMRDFSNVPQFFGPVGPLNAASLWLLRRGLSYYERQVLSVADHLITQTESSKRRLMELYELDDKPITVIENGVDSSKFDPAFWWEQREIIRSKYGWQDRIVCLYAGFLDKVNGIEFLLQGLSRLTGARQRRLKIVLLGRGPLQGEVERAAEEYGDLLDFLGLVDYSEMPGYYAACDVFMIPRLPLGPGEMFLPMKLLEAMAMGKIVLVSDVLAMAEVVCDGENGLVFEKGSIDDFLRKLEAIVVQDGRLSELGQRARQDVLDRYTWEASRKKLQLVYEALLE